MNRRPFPRARLLALCLGITAVVSSGCRTYQPNPNAFPTVQPPAAYTFPVAARDAFSAWWESFTDPNLNQLVAESLPANFELGQSAARIRQAQAIARRSYAEIGPELSAFAGAAAGWDEDQSRSRTIDVGTALSWEVDLWGRLAAATTADQYETFATVYDYDALRLLVSGELADTYYRIVEQHLTLELLERQKESSEKNLDFIQHSFGYGSVPSVDVLQQKEQLASVMTQFHGPQSDLKTFQHRLDVLTGKSPDATMKPVTMAFPEIPEGESIGVPSELLMLRPDLRAIAARLVAIDYRIAEAIADCYPRLRLSADFGHRSTAGPSALFANALADMVGPILDSGRRQSVIDQRRAEFQEQLARFNEAFLIALEEVETALWREHHQRQLIASLEEQRTVADNLLSESKNQYAQDASFGYLSVLSALQSLQRIEREIIVRRRELVSIQIQLRLAVGGPLPSLVGPASPS